MKTINWVLVSLIFTLMFLVSASFSFGLEYITRGETVVRQDSLLRIATDNVLQLKQELMVEKETVFKLQDSLYHSTQEQLKDTTIGHTRINAKEESIRSPGL